MNLENKRPRLGRTLAGCVLGLLLAMFSPLAMLTELMSLTMVLMLPSIGLIALYYWAGRGPALFSGAMVLIFDGLYLGSSFMWALFFMTLLPLAIIIPMDNRPFAQRMSVGVTAFVGGVLAGVLALYLGYGGNMIERVMRALPEAIKGLPQESMSSVLATVSAAMGQEITVEGFYKIFSEAIETLIPYYQLNLPGQIFSGALASAVICVGVGGYLKSRQAEALPGTHLPLREWGLSSSATGGILIILSASFILEWLGMRDGLTLRVTVYNIAVTAFCIQALASMSRRLHASPMRPGLRVVLILATLILCLLGGAEIIALYGCLSAIFGSKGALRQKMDKMNDKNNDGQ